LEIREKNLITSFLKNGGSLIYSAKDLDSRHPKIQLSSFGNNYLRVMNPFMPMWWSFCMPGAGHIMIGKIAKGFLLFIWEMVINNQAHINLSIVYSMTGKFQQAKDCLDLQWFFVYIGVYIFNVWDSYRLSTDVNQFSMLAVRERTPIRSFNLSLIEINYLQKINVWISVFWSLVTPGLGHLMIRNFIHGFYLMAWHIVCIYQSKLAEAVYFTVTGEFQQAIHVMNYQWTLFLPSIYCFAVCDCYYRTIEINQLFKIEQARYLKEKYATNRTGFLNELG